jgi:signal transduction histidine kinase
MVCLAVAGVFAGLAAFSPRRRTTDVLFALYMLVAASASFVYFLEDNIVPAGASVWGGAPGQLSVAGMRYWTYLLNRSNWILGLAMLAIQMHFVLRYCRSRNIVARRIWILYLVAAGVGGLTLTKLFAVPAPEPAGQVGSWRNAIAWLPRMSQLSMVFVLIWAGAQVYSLQMLFGEIRKARRRDRFRPSHLGWVLAGMLFIAVLGTVDYVMGVMGWPSLTMVPVALTGCASCLSVALLLDRREAHAIRENLVALRLRAWTEREDERKSLARDLHDSLAQELAVLDLVLSAELMGAAEDAGNEGGKVDRVVERCRWLTRDLRHVCFGLFPPALESKGLAGAVDDLLEYCRLTGLDAQLVTDEAMRTARLHRQAEEAIFRIIQEAVSNASRHAHARSLEVDLRESGSDLVVEIRDTGVGLPAQPGQGLGLETMRQRVKELEGRLEIQSDQGTCVRAVVPLAKVLLEASSSSASAAG